MKRTIGVAAVGILVVWLISGVYVVGARETGVLLRFGRIVESAVSPGLHYHLPYPFETIVRVPTGELHTVELKFTKPYKPAITSYLLTGDENVVRLRLTVHFRIVEPARYVFAAHEVLKLVERSFETAAIAVLASQPVDSLLTTGKGEVAQAIKQKVQTQIDSMRLGIEIASVLITELSPPVEVAASFKDVASAREDKERRINEVEGARNRKLPTARGRATEIVQRAQAYAAERISEAQARAHRFETLNRKARLCRVCVETSLYKDTLVRVLETTKLMILDSEKVSRIVLPLSDFNSAKPAQSNQ